MGVCYEILSTSFHFETFHNKILRENCIEKSRAKNRSDTPKNQEPGAWLHRKHLNKSTNNYEGMVLVWDQKNKSMEYDGKQTFVKNLIYVISDIIDPGWRMGN